MANPVTSAGPDPARTPPVGVVITPPVAGSMVNDAVVTVPVGQVATKVAAPVGVVVGMVTTVLNAPLLPVVGVATLTVFDPDARSIMTVPPAVVPQTPETLTEPPTGTWLLLKLILAFGSTIPTFCVIEPFGHAATIAAGPPPKLDGIVTVVLKAPELLVVLVEPRLAVLVPRTKERFTTLPVATAVPQDPEIVKGWFSVGVPESVKLPKGVFVVSADVSVSPFGQVAVSVPEPVTKVAGTFRVTVKLPLALLVVLPKDTELLPLVRLKVTLPLGLAVPQLPLTVIFCPSTAGDGVTFSVPITAAEALPATAKTKAKARLKLNNFFMFSPLSCLMISVLSFCKCILKSTKALTKKIKLHCTSFRSFGA